MNLSTLLEDTETELTALDFNMVGEQWVGEYDGVYLEFELTDDGELLLRDDESPIKIDLRDYKGNPNRAIEAMIDRLEYG